MKVGIIQSNFLPWRGYFDFIREVDLFIIHDDLQYTKADWRNRNRIKSPKGTDWISVPVHYEHTSQSIEETRIDEATSWAKKMLNRIRESYQRAPHFEPYFSDLNELLTASAPSISELNLQLIHWVCRALSISTPITLSRQYHPEGAKTERLLGILKQVKATTYLSGPAAQAYLIPQMFEQAGIRLEYKTYDYPEYEQLYPPFESRVSIIDLLFMTGKDALKYIVTNEEKSKDK